MSDQVKTNNPTLLFKDISSERYRTYIFPDCEKVSIQKPLALHVSKSGGHRVYDTQGKAWYIPKGWIALVWENDGPVAFNF